MVDGVFVFVVECCVDELVFGFDVGCDCVGVCVVVEVICV